MNVSQIKKRITAKKYQGDDHYSWAIFIDGIPFVTGLSKPEITYYKQRAIDRLIQGVNNAR